MTMAHVPHFAALMGGTLLTLQTLLMLSVGRYRNRAGKGVGFDGDVTLERLIRRHGNFAENAALFLIVLALYEIVFGRTVFLLVIGATFLVARLLHAVAFTSNSGSHLVDAKGAGKPYILMRVAGAGLTALSTMILGIGLIVSILLDV